MHLLAPEYSAAGTCKGSIEFRPAAFVDVTYQVVRVTVEISE